MRDPDHHDPEDESGDGHGPEDEPSDGHGPEDEPSDGHGPEDEPSDGHGPSGLTLLVAVVLVVAAGLFLSAKIGDMTRMQDCLLSGRTNCAPVAERGAN